VAAGHAPALLGWIDAGLEALAETPLAPEERMAAVLAVTGQARWNGIVVAGYAENARASGRDDMQVAAQEQAFYDAVITAEAYPHLRTIVDAGVFVSPFDPFRWAFERTLDGIESYMAGLDRGESHRLEDALDPVDDLDVADDKRYRAAAKAAADARKAVLQAEKALRQARKAQRQALAEARERRAKSSA